MAVFIFLPQVLSKHYRIVQESRTGTVFFINNDKVMRAFPDSETLAYYGILPDTLTKESGLSARFTLGAPVPSARMRTKNPDTRMTALIQKVQLLARPLIWEKKLLIEGLTNPSVISWNGKWLLSWRKSLYDGELRVSWLSPTSPTSAQPTQPFNITVERFDFNQIQEDPRLLLREDGRIFMQYTCKKSLFFNGKQCFAHLTPNGSNLIIAESTIMSKHGLKSAAQKNWVAFEYQGEMHFLAFINPMTVIRYNSTNNERTATLNVVHNSSEVPLPWSAEYGLPIRGGSPAVRISEHLYLAFFHTVARLTQHDMKTYFMGAMTFCAQPPFNLHSMSPHPILLEEFYTGPWIILPRKTHPGIDYVMFPIGVTADLVMREVYVSFGHQDKVGYLARFGLDDLLASLDPVAPCAG